MAHAKSSSSVWQSKYILAEIVFGFTFWSTFNEYVPTLWFFPLNKMDFTGNEAYLACFLLPILLGSQYVRTFFLKFSVLIRVVAFIIGLLSFYPYDLKNPPFPYNFYPPDDPNAGRMFTVAVSVILSWMCTLRVWWSSNPERRYRNLWGSLLGLVVMNILRLAYVTINPVTTWTTPIFVNIAAVLWAGLVLGLEKWPTEESHRNIVHQANPSSSLAVGAALGGQLFLTHMLYTSHGTIPRHLDLSPFPTGVFVLLTVVGGIVLTLKVHQIGTKQWALVGVIGTALFILGEDGLGGPLSYLGLLGSILLGLYVISMWPIIVQNYANTQKPGRVILVEALVYLVFIFWSVWVVAYKFIPWYLGSNLLRERNRTLIIAALVAQLAGAVEWRGERQKLKYDDDSKKGKKRALPPHIQDRLPRREVQLWLAIIMLLLFAPACVHRLIHAPNPVAPSEPGKPTEINGMIWNIHFGYDNFGRNNFEDVTAAVLERKINVLGILESDLTRIITGGRDIVEYLEQSLNMHSDFGPNSAKSTWGCGLLSSFPIEKAEHIILPSPEGELACLIDALIRVDGKLVNVIVTHFGNTEDKLDRELQTAAMSQMVKNQTHPVIVLSYITARPKSANYYKLLSSGLVDTTDAMNRYCQYIFYKALKFVRFNRWDGGTISDTEAQWATWTLP